MNRDNENWLVAQGHKAGRGRCRPRARFPGCICTTWHFSAFKGCWNSCHQATSSIKAALKIFESPTITSNWLFAALYIEGWHHEILLAVGDIFVFIQILFPWPVLFMTSLWMSLLVDHFWSPAWPVTVTSQVCLGLKGSLSQARHWGLSVLAP